MESSSFYNEIFVKTNIAERLDRLLSSKSWKGEAINLGGVTDNYQPIEAEYKIMPDVWDVLIKHKNPCTISTKSDLILRDYDLIEKLAGLTYVNIASTITCIDEKIREKIEPGAAPSERRFNMLEAFGKTEAFTGMHTMPVIPFITDSEENLEGLFCRAQRAGIDYAIVQPMNLKGETKLVFLSFVKENYPKDYNV